MCEKKAAARASTEYLNPRKVIHTLMCQRSMDIFQHKRIPFCTWKSYLMYELRNARKFGSRS